MKLLHLALTVRDREAARTFYQELFAFAEESARYFEDGVVIISNDQGFDLAFKEGRSSAQSDEFLHFGFSLESAAEVEDLLTVVESRGLTVVENDDEPGFRAFKFLDPDGYKVQVYHNADD